MRISVLDQSPISDGMTGADALRNSVDLAQLAESLGYHRYWIAEHHGTPMLASASPEILIGAVAAATTRLRVGSGGVMLPHYSPLKVAEVFSMLAGLYGDRIDLAVGRAAGTDPRTTFALQRDRRQMAPDDFPSQLAELLGYIEDSLPPDHPFARLSLLPGRPGRPALALLGSSEQSSIWAAETGLPYAFADFINANGAAYARSYRRDFAPDAYAAEPHMIVAVNAICAETDEEAWRIAASSRMVLSLLLRGQLLPVPSIDDALAWFASEGLDPRTPAPNRRTIVGSPATVRAALLAVQEEYEADELMVVTITHAHDARRRSYELIAEAV